MTDTRESRDCLCNCHIAEFRDHAGEAEHATERACQRALIEEAIQLDRAGIWPTGESR